MNKLLKKNNLLLLLILVLTLLLSLGCSSNQESNDIEDTTANLNIPVSIPNIKSDFVIQAITDDFNINKIEVLIVNQNNSDDQYQQSEKISSDNRKVAFNFEQLTVGETYNVTINAVDNNGYNVYSGTDIVTISAGDNLAKIDLKLLKSQGLIVNLKGIAEESTGQVKLEPANLDAQDISSEIERVEFNESLAANDYTLTVEMNGQVVKTSEISLMPGRTTIVAGIDMTNPDVYLKESNLEITWGRPGPGIGVSPRAKDFINQIEVAVNSKQDVYYTLDGSDPADGQLYKQPFTIGNDMSVGDTKNLRVYARGADGGVTKTSYQFNKKYDQVNPTDTSMKLGALYTSEFTSFRIWSPDSRDVSVVANGEEYQLKKLVNFAGYEDIYHCKIPGDLEGAEYQFKINDKVVRDPYGVMAKADEDVNIVMDVNSIQPPGGWSIRPELQQREDAIIYEMHIRDFTIDDSSGVSDSKRGKFSGMVEEGTTIPGTNIKTGIDHLKELGVTHVQIMPFYDFVTEQYNWGYDPRNYNVPEEQYAMNPDNYQQRVKKVKKMINKFHENGIRVIMDVVYNHSYSKDMFRGITNKYYTASDWSGCGNSVNTNQQMVSRMIRDSLEYWVDEYNVDGFRFDLMGIYYTDEVKEWGQYLTDKYSDRNLLLYGEPWAATSTPSETVSYDDLARLSSSHIGSFNDQIRNSIIGSNSDALVDSYMFSKGVKAPQIKDAVAGYDLGGFDFGDPEQTINYVSAHDNLALWDNIKYEFAEDSNLDLNQQEGYARQINKFAMGIIGTAQGIPFMHGGDELLRTKVPDGKSITNPDVFEHVENSYNAPDKYNKVNWNWKTEYDNDNNGLNDVYEYYQDLIELRKNHPGFRMNNYSEINSNLRSYVADDNSDVVISIIDAAQVGDSWNEIRVIYNSGSDYSYSLPAGEWKKVFDASGRVDEAVSGSVSCQGTAITVLAGKSNLTDATLTVKDPTGSNLTEGTEVIASLNNGSEITKTVASDGQIKFSDLAVQETTFSLKVANEGQVKTTKQLSETGNNFTIKLQSPPYIDGTREAYWDNEATSFTDPSGDNGYGSGGDSIESVYVDSDENKLYAYLSLDTYSWGKDALLYIDVVDNKQGLTDFTSDTSWSWGNRHATMPNSIEAVLSAYGDRSGYGFFTFLDGTETKDNSIVDIAFKDGNLELSIPLEELNLTSGDKIKVFAEIADGSGSIHDAAPGDGSDDVISDGAGVFDFANLTTDTTYVISGGSPKSSANDIISFELAEQTEEAVIDSNNHTVDIEVANGTDLTKLKSTIEVSDKSTISPASGTAQDFSSPVTYMVTAEDGTRQDWTVTLMEEAEPSDTTSPTVNGAQTLSLTKIQVSFNEALEASNSPDATAFTISGVDAHPEVTNVAIIGTDNQITTGVATIII